MNNLKLHLTDPITNEIYICPITLDCGCTYDRYTLSKNILSDDVPFFKCINCGKTHQKGIISRTKVNKQLEKIIFECYPELRQTKKTIFKKRKNITVNTRHTNKIVDIEIKRLKNFDWTDRLDTILNLMKDTKMNIVKYTQTDINKSLSRWIKDYISDVSIKEYADRYMSELGIQLKISFDNEKINMVEIKKCK